MGPLPGDQLTCVIETRSFSFREYLRLRASLLLGMAVRAHGEWRGIYIPQAIACHSFLLFLPSLYPLTGMVLRFINSLFMTSAAIRKRKGTGRIQFFCAWPSSLSWFVFCFPSFCFFTFKNLCVAALHEAGVCFTSSLPFYCF